MKGTYACRDGSLMQVVQVASDHIEVAVHHDHSYVVPDGQQREVRWHNIRTAMWKQGLEVGLAAFLRTKI